MKNIYSFSAGVCAGFAFAAAALFLAGNSATGLGANVRTDFVPKSAAEAARIFPAEGFESEAKFSDANVSDSEIKRNSRTAADPMPKSEALLKSPSVVPANIGKDAMPGIREAESPPERVIDEGLPRFGQLSIGRNRTVEPSCPKSAGEIAMSVDSLAVLASMSTEKIDSLARLMSSLLLSESAGAADPKRSAPDYPLLDVRGSGKARLLTAPFYSEASEARPNDWTVRDDGIGNAHLVNIGDASDSFPVRPGMVIGELGPIGQIEWFDKEIGVVFENGHEIVGDRTLEEEVGD